MSLTTVEIGTAGERIVNADLRAKGWKTNWDTRLPGATDIEASQNGTSILVQVKSAVFPSQPAELSPAERTRLLSRAQRNGWTAYQAKVQLDDQLRLIGKIDYGKLN